jgi:hypothetical protein
MGKNINRSLNIRNFDKSGYVLIMNKIMIQSKWKIEIKREG